MQCGKLKAKYVRVRACKKKSKRRNNEKKKIVVLTTKSFIISLTMIKFKNSNITAINYRFINTFLVKPQHYQHDRVRQCV